jgi:hypothetical protein
MIKIKSMIKIKKLSHPMGFRGKKHEIRFGGILSLGERAGVRAVFHYLPIIVSRNVTRRNFSDLKPDRFNPQPKTRTAQNMLVNALT